MNATASHANVTINTNTTVHRATVLTGGALSVACGAVRYRNTTEATLTRQDAPVDCHRCLGTDAPAAPAAAKPAQCPNRGVTKPGRMYSACKDCGREGKVNRSTGALRAHAPA